ncbi:hypothetical protein BLOT_014539 [Blomia tropicalis]|nr:hypothetical protein BLOT_014539 [Blomia tropicalis]
MPNVTKLEVICAAINLDDSELDNECLRALESLIQHWSPTLITLRLWFQFEPNDYQHLLRTINTLTSIRYLTLEVVAKNSIEDTMEEEEEDGKTSEPCECISKLDDEFDLPLLSRLEEFYYHPTNLSESFFKTLTKYVTFPDSPLNRIGIRTERGITENDMGQFFALSTELSTRFIHVPHIRRPFNPESLTKFFNHCNALTSVDLDAASLSLEQLVISLSPLTSLLWLRLTNAFSRLGRTISNEDRNPMPAQLNSVRGLMVELLATKHTVLQSIHWPFIFPSLTELTVINRTGICSMCSRAAHLGLTKDTSQQRLDCIRYLMEPFRKCPQLQRSFPVNILETSSTNEQGSNNLDFSTMISKNT